MASSKVSSLTASDALAGTELFYADGLASAVAADVKVTSTQIKTWTSASPTLVTPVLGVATGTSIALGGATLGTNALAVTGTSLFGGVINNSSGVRVGFTSAINYIYDIANAAETITGRSNTYLGWSNSATNPTATIDTTLSRNAAGIVQFGTTTANAAGAWLAAKGTLTGGTLADQAQVLAITATQPASPSAAQSAITAAITSAGSASQTNIGVLVTYAAGYTGSSSTFAMATLNSAAGTGSTLIPAAGGNSPVGNTGFSGNTNPTTTGLNIGFRGLAEGGNINVGSIGFSQVAKNSATNIGVVASAINTGTTPVHIGGFFSLNQTTVPAVSAALIADNGAQTDAIFLARDNGSTVFTIADGGVVTTTNNIVGGGSVAAQSSIIVGQLLIWGNNSSTPVATTLDGRTNGNLVLYNFANNDFGLLKFGGTTSSFPAIKRSTTILQVRLADDSAYAPLEANTLRTATAYTVATLPAAGTAGRMAYVTDALAPSFLTTVVGGGAVVAPVFDNGTNWVGA